MGSGLVPDREEDCFYDKLLRALLGIYFHMYPSEFQNNKRGVIATQGDPSSDRRLKLP